MLCDNALKISLPLLCGTLKQKHRNSAALLMLPIKLTHFSA